MKNNGFWVRNEQEANKFAATITLITIIFIALVFALNVVGIFIVPMGPMAIAMTTATLMMLIPSLLVFVLKRTDDWVKYVIITASILMVATFSLLLSYHVILLFIYRSQFRAYIFLEDLAGLHWLYHKYYLQSASLLHLMPGGVVDNNMLIPYDMIVYAIVPAKH